MSIARKSILTVFIILFIDQFLKIWIKTSMFLYQDINVFGNWFVIKFIENNGMAFGVDIPVVNGKMILSIFRILASIAIVFYMRYLIRHKAPNGLLIAMSFILAGAIGNILDCAFYGLIFNESTPFTKAVFFPEGGGYAGFLHGKVVDMLYFPVIRLNLPEWVPFKGGDYFEFFRPIFNIADSAITIGVCSILIFQKKFFTNEEKNPETVSAEPVETTTETERPEQQA